MFSPSNLTAPTLPSHPWRGGGGAKREMSLTASQGSGGHWRKAQTDLHVSGAGRSQHLRISLSTFLGRQKSAPGVGTVPLNSRPNLSRRLRSDRSRVAIRTKRTTDRNARTKTVKFRNENYKQNWYKLYKITPKETVGCALGRAQKPDCRCAVVWFFHLCFRCLVFSYTARETVCVCSMQAANKCPTVHFRRNRFDRILMLTRRQKIGAKTYVLNADEFSIVFFISSA